MKAKKNNRTILQKKFEEQTPTIKNIIGKEYLRTYCSWLELQVEKANGVKQRELLIAFSYWFNENVKQSDNFIFKVEEFIEYYKNLKQQYYEKRKN